MKSPILILAIVALMTSAIPAFAQPDDPPQRERGPRSGPVERGGPGHHRFRSDEGRATIEQVMMARMSKELELDDAQTVQLVRHFSELREKLHEARHQRHALLRQLDERGEPENGEEIAAVAKIIDELRQLEDVMTAARRKTFDSAAENLLPWQQARLYIFLERFESDMRRLIERARKRIMDEDGEAPEGPRGPRHERRQHREGPAPETAP